MINKLILICDYITQLITIITEHEEEKIKKLSTIKKHILIIEESLISKKENKNDN